MHNISNQKRLFEEKGFTEFSTTLAAGKRNVDNKWSPAYEESSIRKIDDGDDEIKAIQVSHIAAIFDGDNETDYDDRVERITQCLNEEKPEIDQNFNMGMTWGRDMSGMFFTSCRLTKFLDARTIRVENIKDDKDIINELNKMHSKLSKICTSKIRRCDFNYTGRPDGSIY